MVITFLFQINIRFTRVSKVKPAFSREQKQLGELVTELTATAFRGTQCTINLEAMEDPEAIPVFKRRGGSIVRQRRSPDGVTHL